MKRVLPAITILLLPTLAFGNVVWPALYTETKVSSFPVIALSFVFEYFVIRWQFKQSVQKSILYALTANLVSGVLGFFLRPLSGIAWELSLGQIVMWLFHWGTFNPVAWFFVPIIGGAINAILELLTIKLVWKEKFSKKNFAIFWLANWVTVGLATVWVIASPPQT